MDPFLWSAAVVIAFAFVFSVLFAFAWVGTRRIMRNLGLTKPTERKVD